MIKYLYGKKEFLLPVFKGECGPRFSNLGHYRTLENEKIRDEETKKSFSIEKNSVVIEINGRKLNPETMTKDPILAVPSRNCYCLCLTSKKNDPEMYELFNANFCLEVNVENLVEFLEVILLDANKTTQHEMFVKSQAIKYYEKYHSLTEYSLDEVVFYKPNRFSVEAEYRIAIFSNTENIPLKTEAGLFPFTPTEESQHISFFNKQPPDFWRDIFIESYEK
ncbi:MAG: hypothetical protein HWE24_10995 [Oceanospirillaceae bacterium]|nr:hypothetical protein [Oceanospirillaceae bacterium]